MKTIIFTGGGTTGHVTKNKILIEALQKSHPDLEIHYLGLKTGKEAELITADLAQFHPISSGKLRRYFSWETIPDFFRFIAGIGQSWHKLGKLKPNLVFSSGGFVALPVAIAAWLRRIPIITHETDSYPGLANRMIGRMANKVLLGYESAQPYFKPGKTIHTGNPVSPALFEGSRDRALKKLGFSPDRKTILVMGGSQGAEQINELVWEILPELVKEWQVVHLTGRGKNPIFVIPSTAEESLTRKGLRDLSTSVEMTKNYRAIEYVTTDYPDFLTLGDIVISRAGGNSLAEIAALGKPAILIPLPLPAAAGDHQRKNALEMQRKHTDWVVLNGKDTTSENLLETIRKMNIEIEKPSKDAGNENTHDHILKILIDFL
jgi:UDP-N-acetylglucosamine--N-acetylmuramyl-(pentapeptide) pyrophosphoryl-undecaprenol N-acetylglucosamine transferase